MTEELSIALQNKLSEANIEGKIFNLVPLTGGASKEIWKFEVQDTDEVKQYILRKGSGIEGPLAIKTSDEALLQQEVKKINAPVPEIVAVSSLDEELGDSYIMKFVEGESIPRKVLRDNEYKDALPLLAFQCGESIAKIHEVEVNNLHYLQEKTPMDQLNELYSTYESFNQPSPMFEYTYLWLKDQDFGDIKASLVH